MRALAHLLPAIALALAPLAKAELPADAGKATAGTEQVERSTPAGPNEPAAPHVETAETPVTGPDAQPLAEPAARPDGGTASQPGAEPVAEGTVPDPNSPTVQPAAEVKAPGAGAAEPPAAEAAHSVAPDPNEALSLPAAAVEAANVKLAEPIAVHPSGDGSPPPRATGGEENPADAETAKPSLAPSIRLDKPVVETRTAEPLAPVQAEQPADPQEVASPEEQDPAETQPAPLVILGTEVPRGTSTRLSWSPDQTLEGIATPTPVLIVNGAEPGPVLCLTAALHGDELNGIEIVRRVLYNLDPEDLSGAVIGVPIVNLQGFHRSSRYLSDRRDLNRYFPGHPAGSSASRIAYSFFEEVIRHCDALVDLHTGSFHRTNLPQLRGDLRNPKVRELTEGFGNTVVMQSRGASGTLRRAAVNAGIPAVTLEAGESMRLQERAVEHGVNGITTLMNKLDMIERFKLWGDPEPVYHRSLWVRADQGGILFGRARLGDSVKEGEKLGVVTDPITNISSEIRSPRDGRIIGMALNQVVLPGYAAFHIAFATPKAEVEKLAADELQFIETSARRWGEAPASTPDDDLALPEEDFPAAELEDPDASDSNDSGDAIMESPPGDDFDE